MSKFVASMMTWKKFGGRSLCELFRAQKHPAEGPTWKQRDLVIVLGLEIFSLLETLKNYFLNVFSCRRLFQSKCESVLQIQKPKSKLIELRMKEIIWRDCNCRVLENSAISWISLPFSELETYSIHNLLQYDFKNLLICCHQKIILKLGSKENAHYSFKSMSMISIAHLILTVLLFFLFVWFFYI